MVDLCEGIGDCLQFSHSLSAGCTGQPIRTPGTQGATEQTAAAAAATNADARLYDAGPRLVCTYSWDEAYQVFWKHANHSATRALNVGNEKE